jgi:GH25 family lysozyme M1 (1,4-beta-N-acetylmuramidase)
VTDLCFGVDVSKWQEAIDWPAVGRSGLAQFAAVRTAIGLAPDERWQANLAGAADHVPVPMAYAVVGMRASQANAADYLVNLVDRVADVAKVGLVVDAENFADGSHPTMTQVHAFRDALHRLTGRWPMAYVPDWFMTQHGYRTDDKPWPWWPSRYRDPPWDAATLAGRQPPLEHGFTVRGPWQFTSSGQVAGISGRVDRNVFVGSLAELRALALGEETDMADAQEVLDAIAKLRSDLTVYGTTGLEKTVEDFATRQRQTLAALARLEERVAALEGVTIPDAQAELIGAKIAIAGHPGYEGEAVLSLRPKEATP